jgi:predicted CoA-binding protein
MSDILDKKIKSFLASPAFGVIGASSNREKYGNKVLRVYLQNHKKVFPVNPREKNIEGMDCIEDVQHLPEEVESISIITPPPVTEKIVSAAISKGIKNIWMQPGAESAKAVKECEDNDINVIAGGPCILVKLGFHDDE